MFTVSLNPSYLCNFRCEFCYLTSTQLSDPTRLPIAIVAKLLGEISSHVQITQVDLYGGEISSLPREYVRELLDTIKQFGPVEINVVTNLFKVMPELINPDITLSVSYDFDCRERHIQVKSNMEHLSKQVHVLVLASPCIIRKDVDSMIAEFNDIENIVSVEIKPYSVNQSNQLNVPYVEHEQFVKRWISSPIPKRFVLTNEQQLQHTQRDIIHTFSDNHIYITPVGHLAVLDFDANGNEYFKPCADFAEYQAWAATEKYNVLSNPYCSKCEYVGRCLTEHWKQVTPSDESCSGHKRLIDWYRDENLAG